MSVPENQPYEFLSIPHAMEAAKYFQDHPEKNRYLHLAFDWRWIMIEGGDSYQIEDETGNPRIQWRPLVMEGYGVIKCAKTEIEGYLYNEHIKIRQIRSGTVIYDSGVLSLDNGQTKLPAKIVGDRIVANVPKHPKISVQLLIWDSLRAIISVASEEQSFNLTFQISAPGYQQSGRKWPLLGLMCDRLSGIIYYVNSADMTHKDLSFSAPEDIIYLTEYDINERTWIMPRSAFWAGIDNGTARPIPPLTYLKYVVHPFTVIENHDYDKGLPEMSWSSWLTPWMGDGEVMRPSDSLEISPTQPLSFISSPTQLSFIGAPLPIKSVTYPLPIPVPGKTVSEKPARRKPPVLTKEVDVDIVRKIIIARGEGMRTASTKELRTFLRKIVGCPVEPDVNLELMRTKLEEYIQYYIHGKGTQPVQRLTKFDVILLQR